MMMDACRKAGLPEPTIEENAGGMQITFLKNISGDYLKRLGLNERQIKAVEYVKRNRKITNKEYQELTGVARMTATRDLTELVEKRILKSSEAKGAGAFYEF